MRKKAANWLFFIATALIAISAWKCDANAFALGSIFGIGSILLAW